VESRDGFHLDLAHGRHVQFREHDGQMNAIAELRFLILLAVGTQVSCLIVILLIARFETKWRTLFECVDKSEALPTTPYLKQRNEAARAHGFDYLGAMRPTSPLFQLQCDAWISPFREIVAVFSVSFRQGCMSPSGLIW
jgi:hypothetical protein